MSKNPDDISFEIKNSENKMIFLVGVFKDFTAYNIAVDFNYSYLDFNSFLQENRIESQHFQKADSIREASIKISIDQWTQKVAFREQKRRLLSMGLIQKKSLIC